MALLPLTTGIAGSKKLSRERVPPVVHTPYEVRIGDTLDISFFTTENLNQTRTVGPDGELFLALIGRVQVRGRTLADLTEELTRRYTEELVAPLITVSVREFSGMKIYVGGEVETPGLLPFRGGMTAVQAIMNAGGFLKTARRNGIVLIRKDEQDQPNGYLINVKAVLKGRLQDDTVLAPSDILFVPRSNIASANKFMEQYFRKMSPIPEGLGFVVDPFE